MSHYSALSILRHGLSGNRNWTLAWRDPVPKPSYDVIIVGGGGHGLATAYYLAKEHGIRNVAVLEKGWLGGGNTGRNTTIVRSNYMMPGNTMFYERSMQLWENLSQDLNYNVMISQRGQFNLCHSPGQMDAARRRGNIMRANGIDAELFDRAEVMRRLPYLDYSPNARFPIHGAIYQSRAGTARHDAVAWGFARGADQHGVDLIQQCEVIGYIWDNGTIVGVETTRGPIRAKKVALAVAGHTGHLAEKAGLRLPIETHVLQAFVTEPLKPLVDSVISFGAAHFYISQSDKGGLVLGGDLDGFNSYAQRGGLPIVEHTLHSAKALMPSLSRLRLLRHWAGVMDMSMDGSPIIGKMPVDGLWLNGGWCYGGFKATPASGYCFAWTIAKGEPHPDNAEFTLERFERGYQIDEKGAGPQPNAH
ncbi:sarcosine oxidase subunit beta family protein [Rhizobium sp. CG4]|jgi:heterotetrameric sarcosine oxidase beta subunit|uniref:sarcosine oxidase subunit beta family protein n=1 Tax=Rhizobium sp. CG4 TaxID=2726075 RepID=UPI0020344EFA|nr:sarcosine oxidase subunit beta family protein [Rhizobium sp. CG4]MCM2456765.1 sarcosine oxidase subunit beta family protein [Rhizobium sp. CG4]